MNPNEQNAPAYEATRDKVAKAIADAIGHGMAEKCYTHADAAISVLSSPPTAGDADWVMVPREPTVEMLRAAYYPDGSKALMLARVTDGLRRDYRNMLAAAPKPAAPPSVTDGPDAAWAQAYKEICAVPLSKFRETFGTGDLWKATETRANEIRALTHPGHKHAQEDAAQEGGVSGTVEELTDRPDGKLRATVRIDRDEYRALGLTPLRSIRITPIDSEAK